MDKPTVILDPHPRRVNDIFTPESFEFLKQNANLIVHDDGRTGMHPDTVDQHLADAVIVIGQTTLFKDKLVNAKNLRAIINVETNFLPNIDYDYCLKNGIYVLTPGSAFANVVAEISLGMAIDLCRGITANHIKFTQNKEIYGLESNSNSKSLFHASVGIIGYGDLGRKLHSLLTPFKCKVQIYDPWMPNYMKHIDAEKVSLDNLLQTSDIIFVFASASSENEKFLNASKLKLIKTNSVFLLMSRANVVDWDDLVAEGDRLLIGSDVFPTEPLNSKDKSREKFKLLSAHRAGALTSALLDIGDQTVADVELILRGLPPMVCRRAQLETVMKSRSKPVEKS